MPIITEFLAGKVIFVNKDSEQTPLTPEETGLESSEAEDYGSKNQEGLRLIDIHSKSFDSPTLSTQKNGFTIITVDAHNNNYKYDGRENEQIIEGGFNPQNPVKTANIHALIIKSILEKERQELGQQQQKETAAHTKLIEMLMLLAKLRAQQLTLYDFENQLRNFFYLLSVEELQEIIQYKEDFDKVFGWGSAIGGKWTDYTMTFFYGAFCLTCVTAVALGIPGILPNQRLTFGFGNNLAEVASDASWNFVDSVAGVAQAFRQGFREAPTLASINLLGSGGMIGCSIAGICEVLKDNVQFAADLTGWSFTFAMFTCAAVEYGGYLRCKNNVSKYYDELYDYCNSISDLKDNREVFSELGKINTLLKEDSWGKRTVELVKISASILEKASNSKQTDYVIGLEQRLNTLILERAETNNHFWMFTAWSGCAVGMGFLSGGMTWATIHTGGANLAFTSLISPILNTGMAMVSAFFRTHVLLAWDDVAKAKQAIKERNEFLLSTTPAPPERTGNEKNICRPEITGKESETSQEETSYKLTSKDPFDSGSNLQNGDIIYHHDDKTKLVSFTVKRFNGEIRTGSIPDNKVMQNDKINETMLLDQIAKKGHIVRNIQDIKGKVSILKNAYEGLSSFAGLFGHHRDEKVSSKNSSTAQADDTQALLSWHDKQV